MVNYLFGKIYKIVGNGNVYIGSTCQLLDVRLRQHNYNYKCWLNGKKVSILTSHKCVVDPNHFIELLELCQCSSKVELHNCERKWIDQLDCVNKNIPAKTQTPAEYYKENKVKIKEKQNEYYKENKEKIKEKQNEYNQSNKEIREKMLEYNKEYYKNNKEKLVDYIKKYHQENKEKIKEKKNEYNQLNKEIQKNYREQNKEKMLEYNKEYYKNNKEKIKEMQKNYRQQNKEMKA
jgi:hypothetical protein